MADGRNRKRARSDKDFTPLNPNGSLPGSLVGKVSTMRRVEDACNCYICQKVLQACDQSRIIIALSLCLIIVSNSHTPRVLHAMHCSSIKLHSVCSDWVAKSLHAWGKQMCHAEEGKWAQIWARNSTWNMKSCCN